MASSTLVLCILVALATIASSVPLTEIERLLEDMLILEELKDTLIEEQRAANDGELLSVFKSFCAFGSGSKDAQPLMDNSKFNKLFRDLKLYDKKLTSTDINIIFSRPEVKPKTERKINFNQFKVALAFCAEKKYGSKNDVQQLIDAICSGKSKKPGLQ